MDRRALCPHGSQDDAVVQVEQDDDVRREAPWTER
jgi:hypothetical protein